MLLKKKKTILNLPSKSIMNPPARVKNIFGKLKIVYNRLYYGLDTPISVIICFCNA